jgi:hypothetical protein
MSEIGEDLSFFESFTPEAFDSESMEERFRGLLDVHRKEEAKKKQLTLLIKGLEEREEALSDFLQDVEEELKTLAKKMAVSKVFRDGSVFYVKESDTLAFEEDQIPEEYMVKTVSFRPDTVKTGLTIEGVTATTVTKAKITHQ